MLPEILTDLCVHINPYSRIFVFLGFCDTAMDYGNNGKYVCENRTHLQMGTQYSVLST